ncbi:MAG: hypothetical protein JKX98_01750 [Alcanivoracaceae bacterium]|nr:hypothetical protein [Alcanivoracaceae bacterium]
MNLVFNLKSINYDSQSQKRFDGWPPLHKLIRSKQSRQTSLTDASIKHTLQNNCQYIDKYLGYPNINSCVSLFLSRKAV